MPRIRKKTSKRVTTRQREKIKHKVSQHHKKAKKQARGAVQKKSKKDPGIPNNFPYKDQILAEVAEQRRQAAAEKQRRKEEKQKRAAAASHDDPEKTGGMDVDEQDGHGFDGVMSLRPAPPPQHTDESTEQQTRAIPVFPGPRTLRQVVEKADVVLHVVDARDPAAGISDALVEAAQDKLTVLLNKADTVPRESLAQWLAHLRTLYTVLPFRVSSAFMPSATPFEAPHKKARAMPKDDALGLGGLWTHLEDMAEKKNKQDLVVAVTGVTNAGKSAVINSLLGSDVFPIYDTHRAAADRGPSTTMCAQEAVAKLPSHDGRRVRLIDTPGLQFVRPAAMTEQEREAMRTRDMLLRCRGRIDRAKDPLSGVTHIVRHADTQDLMLAYGLPAFVEGDVTGFLAGLARVNGLIKKGGVLDHAGAARLVLRDWGGGRLMRYSMPGGGSGGETTAGDATVLGSVRSRGELRGEGRLVRVSGCGQDGRCLEWDEEW